MALQSDPNNYHAEIPIVTGYDGAVITITLSGCVKLGLAEMGKAADLEHEYGKNERPSVADTGGYGSGYQ